jgi:hypothetical protein
MSSISEQVESGLGRDESFQLIRKAVIAEATGQKQGFGAKQTESLIDAMRAMGMTSEEFTRAVAEYVRHIAYRRVAESHAEREAKAEADLNRANEIRSQVEQLEKKERELRATYMPQIYTITNERLLMDLHTRTAPWLYDDSTPAAGSPLFNEGKGSGPIHPIHSY